MSVFHLMSLQNILTDKTVQHCDTNCTELVYNVHNCYHCALSCV